MATKKAAPSTEKTTNDGSVWSTTEGFLQSAWPALVEKGATRKDEPPARGIFARFALHGFEPSAAVRDFLAPLDAREAPPLLDLVPGSCAPAPSAEVENRAEALLIAAQSYRPLWAEIFAGAFEIGSTHAGDMWMSTVDAFGQGDDFVYRYGHDTDELEGPAADGVEALVFCHAACAAHAAGSIDAAARASAAEALRARVVPAFFAAAIDVAPFEPEDQTAGYLHDRATWLVTLLAETDPSDIEIRRRFILSANTPIDAALLAKRRPHFARFSPTAFYTCLATYFSGDDVIARQAAEMALASPLAIVHDLGVLMLDLLSGKRTKLGRLDDVPALRARVAALSLWEPPPALEKTEEDVALDALFDANGYADDAAIARFTEKGDRSFVPRLVVRASNAMDRGRRVFIEILTEWREPSAIEPLTPIAREVDRFHIARLRFTQLVHAAGGPEHAPLLIGILARLGAKATGDDGYLDAVVARAILALADLKDASACDRIAPLIESKSKDVRTEAPISVRNAALYAIAELGATSLLPRLIERMATNEIYHSAGLRWALGRLGALADAATQASIRARLDAVRIHHRGITGSDGVERKQSIALLFSPDLHAQEGDIEAEIALEHSRVLLGAPHDALAELVTSALTKNEHARVHAWALLALRSRPELGVEQAKPLLASSTQLVRQLARESIARAG
ncbi:Hypothetical protein A7982_05732 [Minicystis rosea]|nr:Hypothetical protein A7982_05732 [Minicystis rosea]